MNKEISDANFANISYNKNAVLGKTRCRLYSSGCSTDLQIHSRWM